MTVVLTVIVVFWIFYVIGNMGIGGNVFDNVCIFSSRAACNRYRVGYKEATIGAHTYIIQTEYNSKGSRTKWLKRLHHQYYELTNDSLLTTPLHNWSRSSFITTHKQSSMLGMTTTNANIVFHAKKKKKKWKKKMLSHMMNFPKNELRSRHVKTTTTDNSFVSQNTTLPSYLIPVPTPKPYQWNDRGRLMMERKEIHMSDLVCSCPIISILAL